MVIIESRTVVNIPHLVSLAGVNRLQKTLPTALTGEEGWAQQVQIRYLFIIIVGDNGL